MSTRFRGGLLYALAMVWLVLTIALAIWWLVFGLAQAEQLALPFAERTMDTDSVNRMLITEGGVLIALIVAGGTGLLVAIRHEKRRQATMESFFMAFTHELKTSLARVQLQAESLQEELPGAPTPVLDRLLQDSLRLQLQLENSLFFAQPDGRLWLERLDIGEQINRAAAGFPSLEVRVVGEGAILGDSRALRAVLRNVFHNSMVHGGATELTATIARGDRRSVVVRLSDNGRGASPEMARGIGAPSTTRSASKTGFGLFVSRQLMQRMDGDLRWQTTGGVGFTVDLELPEPDA